MPPKKKKKQVAMTQGPCRVERRTQSVLDMKQRVAHYAIGILIVYLYWMVRSLLHFPTHIAPYFEVPEEHMISCRLSDAK
jgi:hypothetical protein